MLSGWKDLMLNEVGFKSNLELEGFCNIRTGCILRIITQFTDKKTEIKIRDIPWPP